MEIITTKLRILNTLKDSEKSPLDISKELELKLPGILRHIKELESKGHVKKSKEVIIRGAKKSFYKLTEEGKQVLGGSDSTQVIKDDLQCLKTIYRKMVIREITKYPYGVDAKTLRSIFKGQKKYYTLAIENPLKILQPCIKERLLGEYHPNERPVEKIEILKHKRKIGEKSAVGHFGINEDTLLTITPLVYVFFKDDEKFNKALDERATHLVEALFRNFEEGVGKPIPESLRSEWEKIEHNFHLKAHGKAYGWFFEELEKREISLKECIWGRGQIVAEVADLYDYLNARFGAEVYILRQKDEKLLSIILENEDAYEWYMRFVEWSGRDTAQELKKLKPRLLKRRRGLSL